MQCVYLVLAKVILYYSLDINDTNSFTVIKPLDNSANETGAFECNRRIDKYEEKTVAIPAELVCDQCILQFALITPNATFYSCADISVLDNQTKECPGECLNKGICVDGICLCKRPYHGEFCEVKSKFKY